MHEHDDLPPLSEAVVALTDVIPDDSDDRGVTLERLALLSPVELGVGATPWGGLMLRGSTPTQRTETTFLPVWHRLALTLEWDDAG